MYRKKTFTMKKLLVLVPVFLFAACGGIDVNIGSDANAGGMAGAGSVSSSGSGGSGGSNCQCNDEVDGTRLNRLAIIGEDGSRMLTNVWRDNVLNTDCTFQSLPNGETRCMPEHVVQNYFLDSACTVPVFIKSRCDMDSVVCKVEYVDIDCVPTGHFVRIDEFVPDALCFGKNVGFKMFAIETANKLNGVGNIYSRKKDGSCDLANGLGGPFEYEHYSLYQVGTSNDFVKAIAGPGL
jgi:hypothetical protein